MPQPQYDIPTTATTNTKIRYLGEGSYGCTFYPGLNCNYKNENIKFITKIQKEKYNANETTISTIIRSKIPKYALYYAPIIKTCPVDIAVLSEINKNEIVQKCGVIRKRKADDTFVSNRMRYAGRNTLEDFLFDNGRLTSEFLFLDSYLYLLNAFHKLDKINIIHYDIKENNIIYNEYRDTPIIIDFGLSWEYTTPPTITATATTAEDLRTHFYIYAPEYAPWSFEIHLISYLVSAQTKINIKNNSANMNTIRKIMDEFVAKNPLFRYLNKGSFIEKTTAFYESMLAQQPNQTWEIFIYQLMEATHKTWNNYGVAVVYFFFIKIYELQVAELEEILTHILMNTGSGAGTGTTDTETTTENRMDCITTSRLLKKIM